MLGKIERKQPFLMKTIKHGVFPLLFYFLAFCLLTYPLIFKFSSYFYTGARDGLQNIWNLWWVNLAVIRPDLHPTIWQTNMLHWPYSITLFAQTLNPFDGYLAVFLRRFMSLTETFNTITIFSFVMGGICMYWFTYYLTKSFWGSILAGFIFTFSNYHFMDADQHLQLTALEWIPLFILLWYCLITRPNPAIAVGAAIGLWMVILCDYYYFFYCGVMAGFIFIWYAVINKNALFMVRKKHFLSLATFAVTALLLIGPMVGALLVSNYRDPLLGSHNPVNYSMDLLGLFIPEGHWYFNQWTQFYWSKIQGGGPTGNSVYLGIPVFVILGYVWIKRKTLEPNIRQQIYLWSITIGFFFLMALGPTLQVWGKNVWSGAMPYSIMTRVLPFLDLSGVPIRMNMMVAFGASVLCAIGFGELFRQFPKKIIFTLILLAVLVFEIVPKPLTVTRIEVPDYVTALSRFPNDGGVLDQVTTNLFLPLYYQTIHGKPITGGYVSRLTTSVSEAEYAENIAIKNQDYGALWDKYHIRYIVTRHTLQPQAAEPYITIDPVYDQNGIRIYRIGCVCEVNK